MDIVFHVDSDDAERMLSRAARALTPPLVTDAVRDGARIVLVGIRARAPRRTGRLANSFSLRPVSAYEYTVQSDLIYAPVHEYGATIRPRNRTFLRFQIGNRVIFTKGPITIKPRPYVAPTFVEDGDKAADKVMDHIESNFG